MTDAAVAKLQALVRIETISDRDPSRASTPRPSTVVWSVCAAAALLAALGLLLMARPTVVRGD
jgi:hypothetical protein